MGALVSLFRKKPEGEIQRRVKVPVEYQEPYYGYKDIKGSVDRLGVSSRPSPSVPQPRHSGNSTGERRQVSSRSPKPQWKVIKEEAKRKLGVDTSLYNFGISGHTKTGKSSLINAILNNRGAAMTDVYEATYRIENYSLPSMPYVVVWDIPGSGTRKHGARNYFMDKCLYVFDCLIILTQDTLTEEEINLAKQAIGVGEPVVFVRSQCDMTLENMKKWNKIQHLDQDAADNFVDEMSAKFAKELRDTKERELENLKVFFISALILQQIVNNEEPPYHFQEREFIRELKICSKKG